MTYEYRRIPSSDLHEWAAGGWRPTEYEHARGPDTLGFRVVDDVSDATESVEMSLDFSNLGGEK